MKIVGNSLRLSYVKGGKAAGFHGDDIVLILQDAFDQNEFLADQEQTAFLKHIRRNDDVGNAGFILHAEEHETLCRTGALTDDDTSCYANQAAIAEMPAF